MMKKVLNTFLATILVTNLCAQEIPAKFRKIQKHMDKAVDAGLSGLVISVKHSKLGEWTGVSGYANKEKAELMRENHVMALASISKTFTAVATMLLVEDGKIELDKPVGDYLSDEIVGDLPNTEKLLVRNLLNMTSGLVNYERDSTLNAIYLSGRLSLDTLSHLEAIQRYVVGKPALFEPGERYSYSSTNYLLLSLIMDEVLGGYHGDFYRERIFKPLNLKNTYYRETPGSNHVATYGDLDRNGEQDDITDMTIETTNWFIGDDGVYADAKDALHFMESLFKGKIVSAESLEQMKTWVNDDYGFGITYDKGFPFKELMGHSGVGIGTTTDSYYFPSKDMTVAILSNSGIRASPRKYRKAYYKMQTKVMMTLFLF
ncbi:MAG: serine hydrolase domain-containing protein [Cyclobacteriaceae bacterium]